MKTHTIELSTEQLVFVAEHLIRAQLRDASLIEDYCSTICETKKELAEQKRWHTKMLCEIEETATIQKYRKALDQAFDAFL